MDPTSIKKKFPKITAKTLEACLNLVDVFETIFVSFRQQSVQLKSQLDQINDKSDQAKIESENQAEMEEKVKIQQQETKKLKRKIDFLMQTLNQMHARYNKLSLSAFNQLHNIKFKFQNNQRIADQVNFERINQIAQEIQMAHGAQGGIGTALLDHVDKKDSIDAQELGENQSSLESNWESSFQNEFSHLLDRDHSCAIRDAQVLELVSLLSEVTNILHFDLKCLELKNSQIEELKSRVGEVERNKMNEHELFKQRIQDDIQEVKKEYEAKFMMYQRQ